MSLEQRIVELAQAVGADIKTLTAESAKKTEVDAKQDALGFRITVSPTAPAGPNVGDVWISY